MKFELGFPRRKLAPGMEQRKHDRVHVEYAGSFSGSSLRAHGTILDLSAGGCRARASFIVRKDDCLGVLIDVPRYEHPLYIARAVVRWSHGEEFGMEFIQMEWVDQQRLSELVRALKAIQGWRRQNEEGHTS